jgi:hypothetical protein
LAAREDTARAAAGCESSAVRRLCCLKSHVRRENTCTHTPDARPLLFDQNANCHATVAGRTEKIRGRC